RRAGAGAGVEKGGVQSRAGWRQVSRVHRRGESFFVQRTTRERRGESARGEQQLRRQLCGQRRGGPGRGVCIHRERDASVLGCLFEGGREGKGLSGIGEVEGFEWGGGEGGAEIVSKMLVASCWL